MPEIDLTPTEPQIYDGEFFYPALEAEMRKLGYDPRDFPEVKRGIKVIRETRIATAPDKKSFVALDKNGEPLRGVNPLKRLAEELAARIESENGPTDEQVAAEKRRDPNYSL